MLYYTIFDAICSIMFLNHFNMESTSDKVPLPDGFENMSNEDKIAWLNETCKHLVKKFFFEDQDDALADLRAVLIDDSHPENYWVTSESDGRFICHYCEKSYVYLNSLKCHEMQKHDYKPAKKTTSKKPKDASDEIHDYILLLFKLIALLKNLDTAIDMADGKRAVTSAKYELAIFNRTNKIKYVIGCIHLTSLTEEILPYEQSERLIANRTVNLSGGKNNNVALDEYLEMLNRDSKEIVKGHQTKDSIIKHSKEFPHLIRMAKYFDIISEIRARKGFHKVPKYKADVQKVIKELIEIRALDFVPRRTLPCRALVKSRDMYKDAERGLPSLIARHKPFLPYARLRNKRM